jgi:hypothetical protein
MKMFTFLLSFILISSASYSQEVDTWSNVPNAGDDRYTNPKSAVYAGPNGWWNFGEVRAQAGDIKYAFKGGLNTNSGEFILVESGKLQVFHMNFGSEEPAPGTYQVGKEANPGQKKVFLSFGDVSNNKIKNWSDGSGTITVTKANGFLYFKCRNVILQPNGLNNEGSTKQPLKVGMEGAVKL